MRNVKYVDINDIEDVVLTKHEIDIKLIEMKEQESKMKLEEFYMRYCNLDTVLMTDTYKQIPFSISFVYDMIYVFVSKMTDEDKDLLEKTKNKKRIIVVNKKDLDSKLILDLDHVSVSAENNDIEELLNKINELFKLDEINDGDMTYISNAREISLLKKAKKASNNLVEALNNNIPIDMLEIDIKNIIDYLGEVTGDSYDNELIDKIFSRFCLGK